MVNVEVIEAHKSGEIQKGDIVTYISRLYLVISVNGDLIDLVSLLQDDLGNLKMDVKKKNVVKFYGKISMISSEY